MNRVPVEPGLLRWARERAGFAQETLTSKFGRLPEWEAGDADPTLKQLEIFAKAVHVPLGYLFLREPPDESISIRRATTCNTRHRSGCPPGQQHMGGRIQPWNFVPASSEVKVRCSHHVRYSAEGDRTCLTTRLTK